MEKENIELFENVGNGFQWRAKRRTPAMVADYLKKKL